jgi:hypothetical protein
VLAQDVNPGTCREKSAYNIGQWCTKSINKRFNGSFKFSAKHGYYAYVNSWKRSSDGTVTMKC